MSCSPDRSRSATTTAATAAKLATVRLRQNQPAKSVSQTDVIAATSTSIGAVGSRCPMPNSMVASAAIVAMLICSNRSRCMG